jgi:23S rRNA pseudouridine2605 synthase
MALQRLQKILAQAGIASRRSAERLILERRVRVNGRIVSELGARANPVRDRVEVDGKRLVAEKPVYLLMHKPRGVVTTLDDPEGRKSIKDLLRGVEARVFPVGRLDFQTSGVLLLTNDGAMAQALLHPTRSVPKLYHAKVQGPLDDKRLELLRSGVTLDDGEVTAPAQVDIARKTDKFTFIDVTIAEGKNRQIHRMLDAVGRSVLRLTRTAFAGMALEGLRPGQIRPLTQGELNDLKEKYLNPSKKPKSRPRRAAIDAWGEEPEGEEPVRGRAGSAEGVAEPGARTQAARRGGGGQVRRWDRDDARTRVGRRDAHVSAGGARKRGRDDRQTGVAVVPRRDRADVVRAGRAREDDRARRGPKRPGPRKPEPARKR